MSSIGLSGSRPALAGTEGYSEGAVGTIMSGDLYLFFPEWQGSGPGQQIHAGAWAVRRLCPFVPFQGVPVETRPVSGVRHGILGYDAVLKQQAAAHELIRQAAPRRIFSLGGDCGIELGPVSWLNHLYGGSLAVVWLDAHGDLNTPESSPSKHFHGMPLRFLLEAPPHPFADVCFSRLQPLRVLLVGVRALDEPERRFIEDSGVPLISVGAVEANPDLLAGQVARLGVRAVYLHIDLDVLDPSELPDVMCPATGGLRLATLRAVLESIKNQCDIVGYSVLEYVDRRDGAGASLIRGLVHDCIGDWLPSARG